MRRVDSPPVQVSTEKTEPVEETKKENTSKNGSIKQVKQPKSALPRLHNAREKQPRSLLLNERNTKVLPSGEVLSLLKAKPTKTPESYPQAKDQSHKEKGAFASEKKPSYTGAKLKSNHSKQNTRSEKINHTSPQTLKQPHKASAASIPNDSKRVIVPTPLPPAVQQALDNAINATDTKKLQQHTFAYYDAVEAFAHNECQDRPSPGYKEAFYNGMVELGARTYLLDCPPPEVNNSTLFKHQHKERLALEAEGIYQARYAASQPSEGIVGSQMNNLLLKTYLSKNRADFLSNSCMGLQMQSASELGHDLRKAKKRQKTLQSELKQLEANSPREKELADDLLKQNKAVARLDAEIKTIEANRSVHSIKSYDDLFLDCYSRFDELLLERLQARHKQFFEQAVTDRAREKLLSPEAIARKAEERLQKKALDFARGQWDKAEKKNLSIEQIQEERLVELRNGVQEILAEMINSRTF